MINTIIQYVKNIFLFSKIFVFLLFLVHFVVRVLNKGREDNEAIKRFITYNLEKHVREHPGQKIVLLFDLSEAGIGNLVS
jgi:hypothetical protein